MTDLVNHPAHYMTAAGIEAIDVIERYGLDASLHLGNAMKYLLRAGRKGDAVTCLRKAQWYVERWIVLYTAGRADVPQADESVMLWAMPDDVLAAFGLTDPRDPVDAMRSSAVHWLLDLTLHRHLDPMDAIRAVRISIDLAIKKGTILPVPHRVPA
jgi:hypothetical protein